MPKNTVKKDDKVMMFKSPKQYIIKTINTKTIGIINSFLIEILLFKKIP